MMNSIDSKRYFWVVVSAMIQGLLLGLYAVVKSGPLLCMPLSIIFIVPFAFWLTQEYWGRRLWNFLIGLTLVLVVFWVYRLWSLYSPNASFYYVPSQKSDLIRISLAVFLMIPFFQCRIAAWSWRFPYSEIFFQFCRNLFLLFQAAIVIAVFWGLLVTAGLLFDLVGLEGVPYFIFSPLVAVPLSSLAIAISISVAIKHPGIDSLGRWLLSVLAWLLPVFSILSMCFVVCLPFLGLRTLWSTGQTSTLMILLQFGTIILANAAYLDGSRPAFRHQSVNQIAKASLILLPVFGALSIYSLFLRISQYGLTVDRIQAAYMAIITAGWGLGYALSVMMGRWPSWIGRVNITAIVAMALLTSLLSSPILDPNKLAAMNQSYRLRSGEIAPEDFDYMYARFGLGRYGNELLSELSESESSRVRYGVEQAMNVSPEEYLSFTLNGIPPKLRRREILEHARIYPDGRKLTASQSEYFVSHWDELNVQKAEDLALVFMDVSSSAGVHNLLAVTRESMMIYTLHDDGLTYGGSITGSFSPGDVMRSVMIRTIEPEFRDIVVGGIVYQVDVSE